MEVRGAGGGMVAEEETEDADGMVRMDTMLHLPVREAVTGKMGKFSFACFFFAHDTRLKIIPCYIL